jgi:hypothetical protein
MDMDGHPQHQPHHQSHERNQNHDHHSNNHNRGADGRNEAEVLDEVFYLFPFLFRI